MEQRTTCAIMHTNNKFDENYASMCPHCSSARFDPDETEPHWKCNKFNIKLNENKNNWLLRCTQCLETNFVD